jgi:hypothetical protein
MTGDRFNVYLPATLARRVREAEGFNLSAAAAAARGIAAALNGHQADELHSAPELAGRLDVVEQALDRLAAAAVMLLLVVAGGVVFVSVRALATS